MINDRRDNMSVYKVYGSYKIASDGFAEIAGEVRENALVLITCEDESVDGGYLNRRVVMAEPM
jgi:sortase (surface protein transpeptidase)